MHIGILANRRATVAEIAEQVNASSDINTHNTQCITEWGSGVEDMVPMLS